MAKPLPYLLPGEKFNRLTVVSELPHKRGNNLFVRVRCDCGTELEVSQPVLRNGNTSSCGCLRKEVTRARSLTHGMTGTKVYQMWSDMVQRTTNPKSSSYEFYGARGITISPEWLEFAGFYRDMGDPPTMDHSIDRADSNGNYCKSNCQWATQEEQFNNRRSSVRFLLNGEAKTTKELAEIAGTTVGAMEHRLRTYTPEVAVTLAKNSKKEFFGRDNTPATKYQLYPKESV